MSETRTREVVIECKDENVAVTYANGLGLVDKPIVTVCHGYKVIFHFAGPPGDADIIPDDPADETWLKWSGSVPNKVAIDTGPARPDEDHRYTLTIRARDLDDIAFSIEFDPVIRPW